MSLSDSTAEYGKGRVKIKLPELLAPAGNLECAITAYKYGADAVYAGLDKFNAREMGRNFSYSDMSKLSAYAKKHGKKFYLTLNTLVKESEIDELVPFIGKVADLEPDAFILQDLGIVNLLKKYFPRIVLHASTQMGFHNSAGLITARRMGFERVILERQVSLEEIKSMAQTSGIELEVFIHGALCCGLSGHCLFSSWIGGWSGNRGKCKQPCRRRYHGQDSGGDKVNGFFFSPQDLYSLDLIGELKEAGIASLKIEGRLKQPDYIRNVVTAYRKVLDAEPGRERQVLGEARNILSGSFGRKWSHGFFIPDETKELLQYDSMGVSGQLIGRVNQAKNTGFQVKLSRRLHVGDRIRIQPSSGEEGPAVTVTRLSLGKRSVNTGRQGDSVFVHCSKEIPSGGMVYKIGESRKDELPDTSGLQEYTAPSKVDIHLDLNGKGMSARVEVAGETFPFSEKLEVSWNETPEPAGNRPLDKRTLVELFTATRNPELKPGRIDVNIDGSWFIPASVLKKRRREFWEKVSEKNTAGMERPPVSIEYPGKSRPHEKTVTVFSENGQAGTGAVPPGSGGFRKIRVVGIEEFLSSKKGKELDEIEITLPHFCPEDKLEDLKLKIQECQQSGIKRFRITGLYQLEIFREQEEKRSKLVLNAAFPLPTANSFAISELEALGIQRVQGWIELEKDELIKMREHSPLPVELYLRGRPFLLATRAGVKAEGEISDSRGGKFFVEKEQGLNYVYPRQLLEIPVVNGFDIYYEDIKSGEQTSFNYYKTWV